ncbi:hypothetical protein AbraIFM66950_001159, partial [Aspergillus brasiliensis]
MRPRSEASWLDIGCSKSGSIVLEDYSQLRELVALLAHPNDQYPLLSVFLGGKTKDLALQGIFAQNNIRRSRPAARIGLRLDSKSADTDTPILFADGDVGPCRDSESVISGAQEHPVAWDISPTDDTLKLVYARLLFLFTDIVCIFANDFPDLPSVAQFLVDCVSLQITSTFPAAVRPRVLVVLVDNPKCTNSYGPGIEQFYEKLRQLSSLRSSPPFRCVNLVYLDCSYSELTRYDRLRTWIQNQRDDVRSVRRENWALLSTPHLLGFFESAVRQLGAHKNNKFNFVQVSREDNPVAAGLSNHISQYMDTGLRDGCSIDMLISGMVSALLMDHYMPATILAAVVVITAARLLDPVLEPRAVFRTLYRPAIFKAFRAFRLRHKLPRPTMDFVSQVESEFVQQFHMLWDHKQSSIEFRRQQLLSKSHELGQMQSAQICLYCLVRTAQHSQACHHSVCDLCPQLFGTPALDVEYRFILPLCFLCHSQVAMAVDILPPTMNPTILAIDGGGVQAGIPLEHLLLIQEALGTECKFFHDSCYDPRLFNTSLQEAYGSSRHISDTVNNGSQVLHSQSKFGVIAANIAKDTRSFVFGNFNAVDWYENGYDYELFRASSREMEPRIYDVARATAAAPFLFPTAELRVGSFQDGGLQDNFTAGIAGRIYRRIWPSRLGIARVISLGTGEDVPSTDRSPRFRHVFRDGFLRRGFDAFMSSLGTKSKWLQLVDRLDNTIKPDYIQMDVALDNLPCTIDNLEVMDDYRNLVILQPGSARLARETTTAMLVARFYFILERLEE